MLGNLSVIFISIWLNIATRDINSSVFPACACVSVEQTPQDLESLWAEKYRNTRQIAWGGMGSGCTEVSITVEDEIRGTR